MRRGGVAVSEKTDKLDRLMDAAKAEGAPPEVLFEIMREAAVQYTAYSREINAPGLAKTADAIRYNALTLVPSFGGHHADAAWKLEIADMPWWKRLWVGSIAPQKFRSQWSAEKRAYGRELVAEALA